jgi:hypothetical protein
MSTSQYFNSIDGEGQVRIPFFRSGGIQIQSDEDTAELKNTLAKLEPHVDPEQAPATSLVSRLFATTTTGKFG